MMTQSHLLITAFVAHRCRRAGQPVRMGAALLGSVLPDAPLALLTLWFFAVPRAAEPAVAGDPFGELYDQYFFNEPVWIVAHNMLHAPLILAVLLALGWIIGRRGHPWGAALGWFAAAAAFHTAVDLFSHRNDGPLLLFPFDWSFRVQAPISYWDPSVVTHKSLDQFLSMLYIAVHGKRNAGSATAARRSSGSGGVDALSHAAATIGGPCTHRLGGGRQAKQPVDLAAV